MKLLTRKFVTPLLALAFKDGVDFVGDSDYRAQEPKQLGPTEWEVVIEWDNDDDDDDDTEVIHPSPNYKPYADVANGITPDKKQPLVTLKDYENKLSKMKPITAQSAPGQEPPPAEVIHLPVKPHLTDDGVIVSGEDPGPLPPLPFDTSSPFNEIEKEFPTAYTVDESSFSPPPQEETEPTVRGCGACLPCASGADCIQAINAACEAMNKKRIKRSRPDV